MASAICVILRNALRHRVDHWRSVIAVGRRFHRSVPSIHFSRVTANSAKPLATTSRPDGVVAASTNVRCDAVRPSCTLRNPIIPPSAAFSSQILPQTRSSPKLLRVMRDDSAGWYRVGLDNGFEGIYPYVWLRDNCRCSECYHPSSWQRAFQIADLDVDVVPTSEALLDDGRVLSVTWPGQHRSEFDAAWLNCQRFSEMEKDVVSSPQLQMWGGELNGHIPTFEFEKTLEDDMELYNWLSVLNTKGLAIMKNAPTKRGISRQLAERVSFLNQTIYGEEFEVVNRPVASNLADTAMPLCLHIDLPYCSFTPLIQMLHCVESVNVTGGENQFVDGLYVAEQLKKEFPDTYDLLRTQEIDFRDAGIFHRPYHLKKRRPVIQYNNYGEFECVNYSDHVRAPYLSLPVDKIADIYRALKVFQEVMYRPGNFVQYRMAAGDVVTFNNGRVLHGRSAFTITGAGGRFLQGGYIHWDGAHSCMRILRENLFSEERL